MFSRHDGFFISSYNKRETLSLMYIYIEYYVQHSLDHAEFIIGNKLLLEISEVCLHHNTRQGGSAFY